MESPSVCSLMSYRGSIDGPHIDHPALEHAADTLRQIVILLTVEGEGDALSGSADVGYAPLAAVAAAMPFVVQSMHEEASSVGQVGDATLLPEPPRAEAPAAPKAPTAPAPAEVASKAAAPVPMPPPVVPEVSPQLIPNGFGAAAPLAAFTTDPQALFVKLCEVTLLAQGVNYQSSVEFLIELRQYLQQREDDLKQSRTLVAYQAKEIDQLKACLVRAEAAAQERDEKIAQLQLQAPASEAESRTLLLQLFEEIALGAVLSQDDPSMQTSAPPPPSMDAAPAKPPGAMGGLLLRSRDKELGELNATLRQRDEELSQARIQAHQQADELGQAIAMLNRQEADLAKVTAHFNEVAVELNQAREGFRKTASTDAPSLPEGSYAFGEDGDNVLGLSQDGVDMLELSQSQGIDLLQGEDSP